MIAFYFNSDPMEVHDYRRGSPDEEPPLQADPDLEHILHGHEPSAADGNSAAKQVARTLGSTQLLTAFHLQGV